jgi:acetamidase/formamidase
VRLSHRRYTQGVTARCAHAILAGTLLTFAAAVSAQEPGYDHHLHLTPENSAIGNFPAQKAPILTIKSGDTVRIDTGGGAGWRNPAVDPAQWLKEHRIPASVNDVAVKETIAVLERTTRYADIVSGHLLVGPIAIEGAMPGDSLEVRMLSVTPRIPYGTTGRAPGRGLKQLPEGQERPPAKVTIFDMKRNVGLFEAGVEVPLGPFMGVMGVLPADSEGPNRRSGPPGLFAGNLDCKELVTGSTLYIPIFHKGALFFTGDAHAAQGDGEITGTAIETANTAVLKFILHKGKTLSAPRAETATHYIAFGLDPDLDNAMQMAADQTVELLKELKGWDMFSSLPLASMAIDYRITQIVDGTKGVHAMIPKKLFVNMKDDYWYKK